MHLGDILVGRGLVGAADIEAALARQSVEGGRLGDNLIAMELLSAEQLTGVFNTAPAVPAGLAETGVSPRNLLNLLLKFMHIEACETLLDLAERRVWLFGPPGNGKTTLATRIAKIFKDVVYLPYAIEIAGQIVRVYDPTLHQPAPGHAPAVASASGLGLQRETFDQRWVACKR